jgi:hypothetical protein
MDKPKIFDITPPQNAQIPVSIGKSASVKKSSPAKEEKLPVIKPQTQKPEKPAKKGGTVFKKILIVFAVVLVGIAALSNFVLNKTKITIYPKTQVVNLTETINLKGNVMQEEKTFAQEFSATGITQEGKKAEGTVRLYNGYSTAAQILVANTRLISSDGLLFRTKARVTVPGGTYVKGKLQPGLVDVQIIADQVGKDYNIGSDTFSVPGFAGTPKYTSFYGKSENDMAGGFTGQVAQITKADIDNAKNVMAERARSEGETSLKAQIPAASVLPPEALSFEILDQSSSFAAGDKESKFTYQVKSRAKAVVFENADLQNSASQKVISAAGDNKSIKEQSMQINWEMNSVDMNSGNVVLGCRISATVYAQIDTDSLKVSLIGKPLTNAKTILGQIPEADRAQIKSWPFWINKIPNDPAKVEMRVVVE